jgi:hypothetical protein
MTTDKPSILIVIPDDKLGKSLLDAFQEHECPYLLRDRIFRRGSP